MWPAQSAYPSHGHQPYQGCRSSRNTHYTTDHRRDTATRAQSSGHRRRRSDRATWSSESDAAPYEDRDIDHAGYRYDALATCTTRPQPEPYEDTPSLIADHLPGDDIVSDPQISKLEDEKWGKSHFRLWRSLLNQVSQMTTASQKVEGIKRLIDYFHQLITAEDQDRVIDLVYDYCEPDVSLEERKIACDLLISLSNNSTARHVQRNIDILCQLLGIIAENSDHKPLIVGSLRQHFVLFPRLTIQTLFCKNISVTRKETGQWKGACIDFFEESLKGLLADHVESEIELTKQLLVGIEDAKTQGPIEAADVDFLLVQSTSLRLDFSRRPQNCNEAELEQEARIYLFNISAIVLDKIFGVSPRICTTLSSCSNDERNGPPKTGIGALKLLGLVKHLHKVYDRHKYDKDTVKSAIDLLSYVDPSLESKEPDAPLMCGLSDQHLIQVLRKLCSAAMEDRLRSVPENEMHNIRDNIVAAIVALFPSIDVSVKANHSCTDTRVEIAEAILIACTMLWPIQKGNRLNGLERADVVTRLRSLYGISQSILSKARQEARAKQDTWDYPEEFNTEDSRYGAGLVDSAQNVHRIASEYLKVPEKRRPLVISAPWLVERRSAKMEASAGTASSQTPSKRKSVDLSSENCHIKKAKAEPLSIKAPSNEIPNDRRIVCSIRGKGSIMAPPLDPSQPMTSHRITSSELQEYQDSRQQQPWQSYRSMADYSAPQYATSRQRRGGYDYGSRSAPPIIDQGYGGGRDRRRW